MSNAASEFALPPLDPAVADRRERAKAVSAELEAIFGSAAPHAAPPRASPTRGLARVRRRGISPAYLGALATAALVGVAAGSLMVAAPSHSPARPPAAPSRVLPVEAALPATPWMAADAQAAAQAAPAGVPQGPAAAPSIRTGAPRPRSFGDIRTADRRLRVAYEGAIRAGVPRAILVADHDRWAAARRWQAHDPSRLTASYRAIAHDLDRAAATARRRPRLRHVSRHSWAHPRYRPWWS